MHERTERHKASTLTLILAFLVAATSSAFGMLLKLYDQ